MNDIITLGVAIITICLFYQFLSNNGFNLNGLELIIYELAYICIFQLGKYYIEFDINQFHLGLILLILLAIYYFLKIRKTKQPTKLWILLIYTVLFFVNMFPLDSIPTSSGLEGLGIVFIYFVFEIGIIFFIIFTDVIFKPLKKDEKNIVTNFSSEMKPLYKSPIKILILIIIIFFTFSYAKIDKYLYNRIEESYKEKILNHLKDKYTDLEFKLYKYDNPYAYPYKVDVAKCSKGKCYISNLKYLVNCNSFNNKFNVSINDNIENYFIKDDFIEIYYEEITNDNPDQYFSDLLSNNFQNNNFNVTIEIDVEFNDEKAKEINTLLKDEKLLQVVKIKDLKVIINEKFDTDESFINYATELYKYYSSYIKSYYPYKSLKYKFSNSDLNKNISFKNDGSIDDNYGKEIIVK